MGYRFLDDYDPRKEQKKKQQQKGTQKAPPSGNPLNPAAQNNKNNKTNTPAATQPRTSKGTALGGSSVTPVQLPVQQITVPKLTKAATPMQTQTPQALTLKLPNIQAFGAGDYSKAGKAMDRIAKTVQAGAAQTASGFAEIAGQFRPTTGQQSMGQFSGFGDLGRAVRESREKGTDINTSILLQERQRRVQQKKSQQKIFDAATRLTERGQQYTQEAKQGLGTVGQFLVDMGVTGTQMAGDALANLILPGSGLVMMGMRSYGQAAGEARREGKSEGQQFLAGLKSAGIEVFTEKMFGAFSKIYGGAAADELVQKLVGKLTENATGQALLTWIVNAVGEGVEEVTSDLLNPLADRLLRLDDGKGPVWSTDDLAQWGYDFLLGTAMGMLGGGQQLVRGVQQGQAQTAENNYYADLRRNGLGSANRAANAQRASDAMGRIMPTRDGLRMPRLVDEQSRTYEERTTWQQIPESRRAEFDEAQRIAQRFGARVVVSQQEGVNGSYRDGVISLNPNAANPVRQTLIHELTHHMESSGQYSEFRETALQYVAENMGADVDSVRQALMADYAQNGVTLDEDGATREIVAKFAEEKLFTDEATVRRLLAEDRNLFQRIYDWIRDMAGKLAGTSEESFLRDAERLYAKALRETRVETGHGTQYSFEQQPIPTWEQLGAKPDMQVVDIRENGLKLPYAIERNRILNSAEIQSLYQNPPVNKDTGELIFVTPATLTHSFSNSGENSIYATKHLRKILENAVLTYAEPSRKADDNSTGVYTLFGAVQTETGIQPVKIKVKEYRIGSSVPKQTIADYFAKEGVVDPYAYAYDERVLALESIEKEEPSSSATANTEQNPPLSHPSSSSTIRVQDLLRLVNSEYQKYVPDGTAFKFADTNNNAAQELSRGVAFSSSLADTTSAASGISIPNNGGNVNTEQYSTGRGLDDLAGSSDYLDALARDENMFTSDAYTLADRLYDLQLRRAQQQEAPPERPAEQVAQEDLDEIAELFTDQGSVFASREDRIRDTENMVSDHTIAVEKSKREKASEAWSYFYRKMVDAGHSVSKFAQAVNDPYLYQIYNQARASSSAGVSMITDAQTNVNAQKVGESLNGIFSPIRAKGEDYYRAFQMYLFDLHNIDRMSLSQNKEAAMLEATAALNQFDTDHPELRTNTEAQLARMTESLDPDVAELAREKMRLLRNVNRADAIKDKPIFSFDVTADVSQERARRALQEHPEFEQYRQQVRGYIDNLMQYRVDSGLMTQADVDYLKRLYPNYVPTMRKGENQAGAGRDRNTVRIGRTVGRAEGGTANLVPLHEALGRQTMKVVREGSKNRFGQRLLDDFVQAGENSKAARYVQEANEYEHEFAPDTLDDMSREQLTKDKTLTVFKDGKLWELTVDDTMFDALKALSPDAAESNAVTRAVRAANNLFKSLVTGYNPTFTIRNTVRDLQTAGLYTRDGVAFARNYPKALAEIKNNGEYWQMYKALGGSFSSVFDYNTGTVKEPKGRTAKLMAKIEALNMAMEQAPRLAEFMGVVEKGGTSTENLADALYAAADVTVNFGRAGTLGKVLNANYVPFLNPGIQGFDKMIRRITETKGGKEWAKLIVRAAALGIAPALLNSLLYHDDEEWDELRDSDKDTNYMFKLGNGTWLKIPKGRELSLLGITADRIGDALRGEDVDLIATLNTMGNQVAPANPLTSNIASALFEAQLFDPSSPGRTWYGGDIENQRLQSYAPGQRYDSSTDVFSKAVGGALGISPKKLNYVLDQYSGVVGDFLLPLLTPQAERGMFSKAFTVDAVTSNRLSGDFYDEADALTYAKNGGDEAAAVVSRFWSKQQSACSDLYKQIREVEASDLSDKEKRQKTRELKALVNGIQKNAMASEETYRAAVEKNLRKGMDADDAYRAANKDCFGAEYALQVYNKDVYEKAKIAKSNGVSYDDYYTYYFSTRGFKKAGDTSVTTQKFDWLQSSGIDLTSQAEIYFADMASDDDLEKVDALKETGITTVQFYQYKVATNGLTKREAKLNAINTLNLTDSQKDALYYLNSYASSTHGKAPWVLGMTAEQSDARLAALLAAEEDDGDDTPKWQQSLNNYLGKSEKSSGRSRFLSYLAEKNGYTLQETAPSTTRYNSYLQYLAQRDGVSLGSQDASSGLQSKYLREFASRWGGK